MASLMVVNRCLKAFANNYGKTDGWVEQTVKLWSRGLNDIHDRDLIRGTEEWCKKRRTPPNLSRLRELIDGNPQSTPVQSKSGCPGCDQTGWREVSRWYLKKGQTVVFNGVSPCDCPLGLRYAAGGPTWNIMIDKWREDGFTDQVFHGTATEPHLTTEQRMTPEQIAEAKERQKNVHRPVKGWTPLRGHK
tara:strand:- start:6348 stop:6917 length:570 start_codon:yes stop_codon:yes gene_type:complete